MTAERLLVGLLRLGAVLTLLAFPTALLPGGTMAAVHRALGLGELAVGPVVEYLARSLSLFYGFHGGLLLLVSFDVRRLAPVVAYLGWMDVVFGAALFAIDLAAGMPWWWTAGEGPFVVAAGAIILALLRRVRDPGRQGACPWAR
jgi:hypothetical protein